MSRINDRSQVGYSSTIFRESPSPNSSSGIFVSNSEIFCIKIDASLRRTGSFCLSFLIASDMDSSTSTWTLSQWQLSFVCEWRYQRLESQWFWDSFDGSERKLTIGFWYNPQARFWYNRFRRKWSRRFGNRRIWPPVQNLILRTMEDKSFDFWVNCSKDWAISASCDIVLEWRESMWRYLQRIVAWIHIQTDDTWGYLDPCFL